MWQRFLFAVSVNCAIFVSGCAEWTDSRLIESTALKPRETSTLPAPKVHGETWVVDAAFVQLSSAAEHEQLWQSVDETVVPATQRGELLANGMRAGRLIGQPIDYLESLNEAAKELSPLAVLDQAGVASELSHVKRRIHCRPNQAYPLPTRTVPQVNVSCLWEKAGQVTGRSLLSPSSFFEMTIKPRTDGQAKVILQPIVEHGELKQNWIGQDQAIVKKLQRERLALEHLTVEVDLAPSQVFVFGPTEPSVSIGQLMLEGLRADGQREQTVLLIRISGASQLVCDDPVLGTQ